MRHRVDAPSRGLTMDDLRARRNEILRIAAAHGAYNVRVFGSVARGQAHPDSDVDFLVDIETNRRGLAYFGLIGELQRALEALLGVPVDVAEAVQSPARVSVANDVVPL
jgi:uncharacterized protein